MLRHALCRATAFNGSISCFFGIASVSSPCHRRGAALRLCTTTQVPSSVPTSQELRILVADAVRAALPETDKNSEPKAGQADAAVKAQAKAIAQRIARPE